ncbi:MAG: 1,6-anhydro-N-acetylmuramyl-L-alanine amidase AmpD [Oleiphilaceae bacterium]|nr:1,6-anhydro-N-acetylmuramyl-L-alanine amidase AmpD [Oleiphilaceae bacterium]
MQWHNGWCDRARRCPSPNFNERPHNCEVDLLVIHCISLPPGEFGGDYIEQFFTNQLSPGAHPYFEEIAAMQVSAHFLIRRTGELVQFVSCLDRAWHAGASEFCGRNNCNDFSIGIELEGTDEDGFEAEQYTTLADLTRSLMQQFEGISINNIVGHEDIAPGRKTDPGPGFDWEHYRSLLSEEVPH